MKIYQKELSDESFNKYIGKHFGEKWYDYIIDSNSDGYQRDSSGITKVLFKFRKNVISKKYQDIAIDTFLTE